MKNICTLMLLMLGVFLGAAEAEKIDFFIKVKKGDPAILEKLYTITFRDAFHYGIENKVFTATATNGEKIAFIESLKAAGHQIETTDDPCQFFIILLDNGDKIELFSIDTSHFKNSPRHIVILQKMLGTAISGGKSDLIKLKTSELPTIRVALDGAGFECVINKTQIIIREKRFVRNFSCPEDLKARILQEISRFSKDFSVTGKNIQVILSNSQLQLLQTSLLNSGLINKINIGEDGVIVLLPVQEKKFFVQIMLNNKFEYEKIVAAVSKNVLVRLTDKELQENNLGVAIAKLEFAAKDLTAADVKTKVWQSVREVCPRIRQRDIRVKGKGN